MPLINIDNNALFIADAHYWSSRDALLNLLNILNTQTNKHIKEIYLMGDISHLLINTSCLKTDNRGLINILNGLSRHKTLYYFEGNHDFCLQNIFKDIKVIPRSKQPMHANYKDKGVLLAHGDLFLGTRFEIYRRLVGSMLTPALFEELNRLTKDALHRKIRQAVELQHPKFSPFFTREEIIKKRLKIYKRYIKSKNLDISMVIEGHFHLGLKGEEEGLTYIGLPSFLEYGEVFSLKKCENINYLQIIKGCEHG